MLTNVKIKNRLKLKNKTNTTKYPAFYSSDCYKKLKMNQN